MPTIFKAMLKAFIALCPVYDGMCLTMPMCHSPMSVNLQHVLAIMEAVSMAGHPYWRPETAFVNIGGDMFKQTGLTCTLLTAAGAGFALQYQAGDNGECTDDNACHEVMADGCLPFCLCCLDGEHLLCCYACCWQVPKFWHRGIANPCTACHRPRTLQSLQQLTSNRC